MEFNVNKNDFRFSVYQDNILLCEKTFNGDLYNPYTRLNIDIRDILPRITNKLLKVLSKREYDTTFNDDLDLYDYYKKMVEIYPNEYRKEMEYQPQIVTRKINENTYRGVECKLSLFINNNLIVERLFFVDRFNLISRWSFDLKCVVDDIVFEINRKIRLKDIENIWDEYELINTFNLNIAQIRELDNKTRENYLRKIKNN